MNDLMKLGIAAGVGFVAAKTKSGRKVKVPGLAGDGTIKILKKGFRFKKGGTVVKAKAGRKKKGSRKGRR